MKEERIRILKMVEEGKLTVEEALTLLETGACPPVTSDPATIQKPRLHERRHGSTGATAIRNRAATAMGRARESK